MPHGGSLVRTDRRQHLEHLAPEPGDEAFVGRLRSDRLERSYRRRLIGGVAEVERDGQSFQLGVMRGPRSAAREVVERLPPPLRLRIQLEAVPADVDAS